MGTTLNLFNDTDLVRRPFSDAVYVASGSMFLPPAVSVSAYASVTPGDLIVVAVGAIGQGSVTVSDGVNTFVPLINGFSSVVGNTVSFFYAAIAQVIGTTVTVSSHENLNLRIAVAGFHSPIGWNDLSSAQVFFVNDTSWPSMTAPDLLDSDSLFVVAANWQGLGGNNFYLSDPEAPFWDVHSQDFSNIALDTTEKGALAMFDRYVNEIHGINVGMNLDNPFTDFTIAVQLIDVAFRQASYGDKWQAQYVYIAPRRPARFASGQYLIDPSLLTHHETTFIDKWGPHFPDQFLRVRPHVQPSWYTVDGKLLTQHEQVEISSWQPDLTQPSRKAGQSNGTIVGPLT